MRGFTYWALLCASLLIAACSSGNPDAPEADAGGDADQPGDVDADQPAGDADRPDAADADQPSDGGDADADTDLCVPTVECGPSSCGTLADDGCGHELVCGDCTPPEVCGGGGVDNECGVPGEVTLLTQAGCFFEITTIDETRAFSIGEVGTEYRWITVDFDVYLGGWREDLFDRTVLNHNMFGLSRVAPISRLRYILGLAAQIHPADAGLRRTTIFYGRVDFEERPPGEGYTAYTTFRDRFPWTIGETYHVHVRLDAETHEQTLEVSRAGVVEQTIVGDIAYFDTSLTSSGWTLEFGSIETDEREVSAVGFRFCDALVRARTVE